MYKATAKWLESPHLPEAARVDTAVRVQVIFRFMAGLLLRYFSDDAVDIFEEVLYWLLDPEIGLQDAIKEWHAECKQNHGKDMSSDTRKKLQTAQTALLESLRHIAAAVWLGSVFLRHVCNKPPKIPLPHEKTRSRGLCRCLRQRQTSTSAI